jgi:large subunit ribosomal protein L3
MGFQVRTTFNLKILKIGDGKEVTPNGGFVNYGNVNGDSIIVEGSVSGPKKRLVRFRKAIRSHKKVYPVDVKEISLKSQQGV